MKCSFCDTEMLHGYLQCPNALWSTKKHPVRFCPGKNEQYALYLKLPFATGNYVESDCCPECKRIIIDSTGYENNLE